MLCINPHCHFNGRGGNTLPISFIDENIYKETPTLLFATVDKLVQLSRKIDTRSLFAKDSPPELIIQDEIHLLNGPLGSLTGLYELLVQRICSNNQRRPIIVASTATTRNTDKLVQNLYQRRLNVFPARGINYDDNFFSYIEPESKRRHIAVIPTGKKNSQLEIKMVECLYKAKIDLTECFIRSQMTDEDDLDVIIALLNNEEFKKDIDLRNGHIMVHGLQTN